MTSRQLNLSAGAWSLDLKHPLSDAYPTGGGMWLGNSPLIFGPPPTVIDERPQVGSAGAKITPTRHGPRDLVIPIVARVPDSPTKLEEVLATLAAAVDALEAGLVRITYTRGDGTAARWIDAYHVGSSPIEIRHDQVKNAQVRVAFRAPDPYWCGAESTVTVSSFADKTTGDYAFSNASRDFSQAGWTFSSDETELSPVMAVDGDVAAAPTIEVDGTADLFDFVHYQVDAADYDQWFRFDAAIADGSTLTVDTAARTVDVDGVQAWGSMQGPNRMPSLPVGDNYVWFRCPGSNANTEVRVSWRPRWLTC